MSPLVPIEVSSIFNLFYFFNGQNENYILRYLSKTKNAVAYATNNFLQKSWNLKLYIFKSSKNWKNLPVFEKSDKYVDMA